MHDQANSHEAQIIQGVTEFGSAESRVIHMSGRGQLTSTEPSRKPISVAAFLMIGLGFLLTFPPFFQLFAA